jgi:hypothetical protein
VPAARAGTQASPNLANLQIPLLLINECEGANKIRCGGSWSFRGSKGEFDWNGTPIAILTSRWISPTEFEVDRSDNGNGAIGMTAIYKGNFTGLKYSGTVTWMWPGHFPAGGVAGSWSAQATAPPPVLAAPKNVEAKPAAPEVESQIAGPLAPYWHECEGKPNVSPQCGDWHFAGVLGQWSHGDLSIAKVNGSSIQILRWDYNGLTAIYDGTVQGSKIAGTVTWYFPHQPTNAVIAGTWSAVQTPPPQSSGYTVFAMPNSNGPPLCTPATAYKVDDQVELDYVQVYEHALNGQAALCWAMGAAAKNDPYGQYDVGYLLQLDGMNVPQDLVASEKYIDAAAAQGSMGAMNALITLLQAGKFPDGAAKLPKLVAIRNAYGQKLIGLCTSRKFQVAMLKVTQDVENSGEMELMNLGIAAIWGGQLDIKSLALTKSSLALVKDYKQFECEGDITTWSRVVASSLPSIAAAMHQDADPNGNYEITPQQLNNLWAGMSKYASLDSEPQDFQVTVLGGEKYNIWVPNVTPTMPPIASETVTMP